MAGRPQARLSQLLRGCDVDELIEAQARAAGALCGTAATSDVVDAIVVVGAIDRDDTIVTSDPQDLERLADAAGAHLVVIHAV